MTNETTAPPPRPRASWIALSLLGLALAVGGCTTGARALRATRPAPVEVSAFAPVFARVEALADRHGPRNVLLVVDLDNTLLAATTPLGSDQWFEWQRTLAPSDPRRVAPDPQGLWEVQAVLHRRGSMRLTEPSTPARLGSLQARGVRALVLTARGPDVWRSTLRELDRHDIDFRVSAPGPPGGWAAVFPPWPGARGTLYRAGVYMVAGQDKGHALRALLARVRLRPRAIVFVDDKARNVAAFADDFVGCAPEVWLYRYGGEDEAVARFRADPGGAVEQWEAVKRQLGLE